MSGAVIIGATLALELVRFIRTTSGLDGLTDEQVLERWGQTNEQARIAHANWKSAIGSPEA